MKRREPKTATEFVNELEADPEYQARRVAQQAATDELATICAADEAALVGELSALGIEVSSVYDFVNAGGAPKVAVPLLVLHLDRPHHQRIWEGIVRALSCPDARQGALEKLKALYIAEYDPTPRWTLANAIGSMAKFEEVSELPGIAEYKVLFRQSRKPPHASESA